MLEQFSPFSGFPYTIAAFIVIILGGLGNVAAGLGAALLLGVLETYGVALTSANLRSVLLYGVFVGALLLFPRGLFARARRARMSRRARGSPRSGRWRWRSACCRSSPTTISSPPDSAC